MGFAGEKKAISFPKLFLDLPFPQGKIKKFNF